MKELVKVCKNGTKVWKVTVDCDKCGGTGIYTWGAVINGVPQYAGTCYKCDGYGKIVRQVREYTPEHEAELESKRQAKAQKRAEAYAERARLEEQRRAEEAKAAEERRKAYEAQKAVSQYQGEVGDKIKIEIVESHTGHYETRFGFTTKYMNVHIMKDAAGNVYTWHTECGLGYETEKGNYESWHGIEEGERFTLAGTIKAHNEYKGEKQTVMTRCKISQ